MKIIRRQSAHVTKESVMLALPTQRVPSSMNAHSTPKITPSVIKTNQKPMELLISSSRVPSGGSFSSSAILRFVLRRRSCTR